MSWITDRLGWGRQDTVASDELDWEEAEVHEGHEVTAIFAGSNIATYNLQVFTPDVRIAPGQDFPDRNTVYRETEADKRVLADLPAVLEMLEEAVEDLLPDGYRVRITEWNK